MLAHLVAPAFLGLGSLAKTIVNDVAGGLFSALAKALMPQAVSNDVLKFLGWLVSLPNLASGNATAPLQDVTTGYGDITILVREITWLAYGLIPVAVSVNALRFMQGTFHRGNQADGFVKVAVAIGGLAIWTPALRLGITLFNSVTIGILNLPVVQTDFRNVMGVLTGATAAYGGLGAVGGLLMIVLDLIVISMIVLKVAMTAVLGILFVAAPIGIALWPIPEFSKIVQLIGMVLFGILMVPLIWVITFATAGAFTGGILNHPGPVGKEFMSVCAGVLCFALAIAVPKFVLGRITMITAASGGVRGMFTGGGGAGPAHRSASGATALERMSHMRSGMLAGRDRWFPRRRACPLLLRGCGRRGRVRCQRSQGQRSPRQAPRRGTHRRRFHPGWPGCRRDRPRAGGQMGSAQSVGAGKLLAWRRCRASRDGDARSPRHRIRHDAARPIWPRHERPRATHKRRRRPQS